MQLTAAVINAGLGDLSLGLEMAGFNVIVAYEAEERAVDIYRQNLTSPVYPLPLEEISIEDFPNVDLLAAHFYYPPYSRTDSSAAVRYDYYVHKFNEILNVSRPRAFFLLINASSIKNNKFRCFLEDTIGREYNLAWKLIDITQMTGIPVRENTACVVGISRLIEQSFEFPSPSNLPIIPLEQFMLNEYSVDPWYYRVPVEKIPVTEDWSQVLCWKNNLYESADFVEWNYIQIPLVRCAAGFRKITHREIGNLKGFPNEYTLSCKDKRWLYKKLIYSGNIIVIQQIAGMINYSLASNPWRNQRKERVSRFEQIFGSYLESIGEKSNDSPMSIEYHPVVADVHVDYALCQGDSTVYFEVRSDLPSRASSVLERLSTLKEVGIPVLVIAEETSQDIKKKIFEQYGIHVWDVKNLLWLFEDYLDIKNEFVAFLDYSTDQIEPNAPELELIQRQFEQQTTDLDLKERLLKIVPGNNQFRQYESICMEILKYILGDCLTLWEEQETSNDGLYRFDLCCKIKNGANQDFFDTVKHYFNTKYIVFEFKNHKEKITQKEIYTTEKYLYEKALRKVAIIISRFGADDHALKAAKGALRENGKLILCLSDNSLLEMIDIKKHGDKEPADFLSAILDDILVHLEK